MKKSDGHFFFLFVFPRTTMALSRDSILEFLTEIFFETQQKKNIFTLFV